MLIGFMAWTASAQQAPNVDDSTLLNAGKTGDQWLMAGGNYEATRYSPLTQIDSSNVSRLGLAWYYDTDSLPGTLEATPVISNGTLYRTVTWARCLQWTRAQEKKSGRGIRTRAITIFLRDPRGILTRFEPDRVCAAGREIAASRCMTEKCTSARWTRGWWRWMRKQAK